VKDRPTRSTVAGRAYLDLQNLARLTQRPTDELHQIYALEGFLARLVESPYADRLVLKGGVLLAALDARRATRDIDFQGQYLSNELDQVLAVVKSIAGFPIDDGLGPAGCGVYGRRSGRPPMQPPASFTVYCG
jgi:hypothetical protein